MFIFPLSNHNNPRIKEMATKDFVKPANGVPEWMDEHGLYFLQSKYLLPRETPWDAYVRIAVAAAQRLRKPKLASKFFEIMWKGWLGPASPVLANMGTERGLPISCNSLSVPDDLIGIFNSNQELAQLSSKGAGVGIYVGDIRSRGTKIKGGSVSSGVIPWCKVYDSTTVSVSQSGVRRGASAFYLPFSHGDIKAFINMRRPTGDENLRCMNTHHAVVFSDKDMEDIRNGGEARELFQEIIRCRIETGEPYLMFSDNVNRVNPTGYLQQGLDVKMSNLCSEITAHTSPEYTFVCCLSSMNLAKWDEWKGTDAVYYATWFLDGVMQEYIDRAKGLPYFDNAIRFATKSRMLGLGVMGYHSLLQSKMMPFGSFQADLLNRSIFNELADESNRASRDMAQEYGEPEWCQGTGTRHTHTCVTGDTKILTKQGQVQIKDLVNKKIEVWNGIEWSEVCPYETGVSALKKINLSNGLSLTCTPDHRFLVVTPKRDTKEVGGFKTIEVEAQHLRIGDCLPKFFTEPTGTDRKLEYAYESGLFCGDGSVSNSRQGKYPRNELRLYGKKQALSEHIQWKSSTTWGGSTVTRGYLPNELLNKHVVPHEYDVLSKQEWLCGLIDTDGSSNSTGVAITTCKQDFAVEVALMVQSLGGEPYVHACKRTGGYGSGKDGVYYSVTISMHSLSKVFSLTKPKRVILPELSAMTKIGKRHLVEVVSIEHLDHKEMTYCFTEPLRGNGVFNGVLTKQCALAPTVSNSAICGNVSPGIEPWAANNFEKKSAVGTLFMHNKQLEKLLESRGMNTEDIWDSITAHSGSVQHLDCLTPEEKEVFLTAREINQMDIIRSAAARQKCMDKHRQGQAQSVNLFFTDDPDETYVTKVHWEAWKQGLKTLYYCRSQSTSSADLPPSTKAAIQNISSGGAEECLACHG